MSHKSDNVAKRIGACVRAERQARNWSMADTAERSGVSKATVSKIERGESSPTLVVLGRLCGAFELTLSTFLTRAEDQSGRLVRASEQPTWTDGETGCVRTLISPSAGGTIELVAVDLPVGAEVSFPASIYAVFHQVIWIDAGCLTLIEGEVEHRLEVGDCLELGPPAECVFRNGSDVPCHYLVAASRRHPQ